MLTPKGVGGRQDFRPRGLFERYGPPDVDVRMSRFEGRDMGLSPRVAEGSPHGFNDVYGGFEEPWRIMAWG